MTTGLTGAMQLGGVFVELEGTLCFPDGSSLGRVVVTYGVIESIGPGPASKFAVQHSRLDSGSMDSDGVSERGESMRRGGRILTIFKHEGRSVMVLTERDRSVTTVLLPAEY